MAAELDEPDRTAARLLAATGLGNRGQIRDALAMLDPILEGPVDRDLAAVVRATASRLHALAGDVARARAMTAEAEVGVDALGEAAAGKVLQAAAATRHDLAD